MYLEPLRAWAVIEPKPPRKGYDAKVKAGQYRCAIYWTRDVAKDACRNWPGCQVVRVTVNQEHT